MARSARPKSSANIYHVMLRGINRQQIFFDEIDYWQFIRTVNRYQEKTDFILHAYCLMGNHIHLLIECKNESIGDSIRRIENSFVYYYNQKYKRTGHLFENRFRSEAINSDQYFLTVYRYIVQNPVKAGICDSIYKYQWSSARNIRKNISNMRIASYFDSTSELLTYLEEDNEDACLDWDREKEKLRISDAEAIQLFFEVSNCSSVCEFMQLPTEIQHGVIKKVIKQNTNMSQISRLTGLSRYQISKIRSRSS